MSIVLKSLNLLLLVTTQMFTYLFSGCLWSVFDRRVHYVYLSIFTILCACFSIFRRHCIHWLLTLISSISLPVCCACSSRQLRETVAAGCLLSLLLQLICCVLHFLRLRLLLSALAQTAAPQVFLLLIAAALTRFVGSYMQLNAAYCYPNNPTIHFFHIRDGPTLKFSKHFITL